jgi:hypothetical protein
MITLITLLQVVQTLKVHWLSFLRNEIKFIFMSINVDTLFYPYAVDDFKPYIKRLVTFSSRI